ncbi:hypothetical protein [Haladaptatus sp. DFWS20]|uniref:hypothetical protein n=1 Tax=Haladaptatus sp. DFWS20 TaxID=3403467 RepID=UPI003EC08D74
MVGCFGFTQGPLHRAFQPNVLFSLVIAGFIYPVVFGELGGAVMHEVHKRGVTEESGVTG